jgi:hypothetical protein
MWWQCREMLRSETCPEQWSGDRDRRDQEWTSADHLFDEKLTSKLNNSLFKSGFRQSFPGLLETWYTTVNTYCTRQITFAKDTFPAIAGIAKQFHKNGLQDYKAGLWLEDMHQGLLWTAKGADGRRTSQVAPSWSWASVEPKFFGGADYDGELLKQIHASPLECIAIIERVDVTLSSKNLFGQVSAGDLIITGPSMEICRNEISSECLDYCAEFTVRMTYRGLEYPLDGNEWNLHWSLRKTAPCNIWTVEKFDRNRRLRPRHPYLLLHVASHQVEDRPRYALCLILEAVPDEGRQDEHEDGSRDTRDRSKRNQSLQASGPENLDSAPPSRKRKRETRAKGKCRVPETKEKTFQYRRIGLATLRETVSTSTIWSNKTVTII